MKRLIYPLSIFLLSGAVYFKTLCPTVSWIDSGELAVVCCTLGIAHPTGYPLYTLIGRIFSLLPFGIPICRLNLLSLLFISSANLILFFLFLKILEHLLPDIKKGVRQYVSFLVALIFSFTPTLWSQATSNEVYGLNFFLTVVLFYLIFLQINSKPEDKTFNPDRLSCLFFFIYGLSFGNHLSTFLLMPGFLFILFMIYRKSFSPAKRFLLFMVFFILGLSVYIYLPVRSSCSPVLNWGDPSSLSNLKRHITGWQYRVWMFSESSQVLRENFKNYLHIFYSQFPFYLLPWIFSGFIILLKKNPKLFAFFLLIFLFDILYGLNYEIADIDPYFLPSFLVASIWLVCGLAFLSELVYGKNKMFSSLRLVPTILFLVLPLLLLFRNYSKQDQSQSYFAYDYAENILRSVKKDPVILTKIWDHYSPWLYLRFVEGKRPDVRFLDTELLRRSWYLNYLKNNYSELYHMSAPEIDRFREQVYLFENKKPYDPSVIEKSYVDMISSFLLKNYPEKPLYCDLMVDNKFFSSFIQFPEGILFRLQKDLGYYPYPFPELELRGIVDEKIFKDKRTLFILQGYPQVIKDRIAYLIYFKQDSLAQALGEKYKSLLSQTAK
jgi:hypothetical protein